MNNVIHAHALMDFIQTNPDINSIPELKLKFEDQFGEVGFTNCTNQIYNFDEIITFLSQRNKVFFQANNITVNEKERCDHN